MSDLERELVVEAEIKHVTPQLELNFTSLHNMCSEPKQEALQGFNFVP